MSVMLAFRVYKICRTIKLNTQVKVLSNVKSADLFSYIVNYTKLIAGGVKRSVKKLLVELFPGLLLLSLSPHIKLLCTIQQNHSTMFSSTISRSNRFTIKCLNIISSR